MFDFLKTFKTIIVTGPQRSGTTICARMIAYDTGHTFLREEEFGVFEFDDLLALAELHDRCVIQAPACSHRVHEVGRDDDTAVVFMLRSTDEIIASERRIKWGFQAHQLKNYPGYEGPISLAKTEHWMMVQRDQIKHSYEQHYHDLKAHPLWVDDKDGWKARQIDAANEW
jgi:hypothetical protein